MFLGWLPGSPGRRHMLGRRRRVVIQRTLSWHSRIFRRLPLRRRRRIIRLRPLARNPRPRHLLRMNWTLSRHPRLRHLVRRRSELLSRRMLSFMEPRCLILTRILLIHRRTCTSLVATLLACLLRRSRKSLLWVVCSRTSVGGTLSVFLSL